MKKSSFARVSLSVLIGITLILFSTAVGKTTDYPIRFAILGDRTGGAVPGIYEQIVPEVERMKPEFVMTVGDMIEGYTTDTTVLIEEWEEYNSIISRLTMPIYYTPGNHDITNDSALSTYRRYAGEPYYSFDHQYLHIIVLDNSRWQSSDELPSEQIEWLIRDLKKSKKSKYTFVFFHKPFWSQSIAMGKPDTLHFLFKNFGVDAVFCGHHHTYYSGRFDGIPYTAVGSSGGGCDPGPTGLEYHFVWVTVDQDELSIAPIKMGSVLPWDEFTTSDMKTIRQIAFSGVEFGSSLAVNENTTLKDNELEVKLRNITDFYLTDTLRWESAEGWMVEPEALPVVLNAGDSSTVNFRVTQAGDVYPVPTLRLPFPYREANSYDISKPLPISRNTFSHNVNTPPVIDGIVSDPAWQNPVTRLYSPDGSPMVIDSTRFYFSYDADNLYLAAYCLESNTDSIIGLSTEHDGPVYTEDCIGYFFQPDSEDGGIYQIYFSAIGTPFDQLITITEEGYAEADRDWNGSYEVATNKGDGFWSIEVRIPLEQLSTIAESGQQWRLNFRRKQQRLGSTADWQVPISYDPKTFGILNME